MTVNLLESPLEIVTDGGILKVLLFLRLLVRVAMISGSRFLPSQNLFDQLADIGGAAGLILIDRGIRG